MDPNGTKPPQNKNVPQDQYNPGNDNDSGGIGVLISQDMILPGAIKPRHLQKSDTLAEGDTYYVDANGNFNRLARGATGSLNYSTATGPTWLPIGATGSILEVSGGLPAWLPIGTTGQVLGVTGGLPGWMAASSSSDGWVDDTAHTWTYASASSFTIAGVDLTTTFTKGTRLKFTQTTVKYATVASSSFSTDTTVNIIVNTDYTIADAAISVNYYSYQSKPQGYPYWFNWTPTWGGFSSDPSNQICKYSVIGNMCTFYITGGNSGTSNATTFTFTAPVASLNDVQNAGMAFVADNSVNQTTPGQLQMSADSSTVDVWKTWYQGTWTGSGLKLLYAGGVSYEF